MTGRLFLFQIMKWAVALNRTTAESEIEVSFALLKMLLVLVNYESLQITFVSNFRRKQSWPHASSVHA